MLKKTFKHVFLFGVTFCIAIAGFLALSHIGEQFFPSSSAFKKALAPEIQKKTTKQKAVIGNLGGVPVSIPYDYARFIEYDSDPGLGDKQTTPRPERTYQSRLRSFGFEVRYPDMAPRSAETPEEKKQTTIFNSKWIRVGILSGEYYQAPEQEERDNFDELFEYRAIENHTHYRFEQKNETEYGLEVYTPVYVDLGKPVPIEEYRKHTGYDRNDKNIYIFREKNGHISSYIECRNVLHDAASCSHSFRLRSPMQAMIDLGYPRRLLPYWQTIQSEVTAILHSFEVSPTTD